MSDEERLSRLEEKVDRLLGIMEGIVEVLAPYAKRLKVRPTGILARMTKEKL